MRREEVIPATVGTSTDKTSLPFWHRAAFATQSRVAVPEGEIQKHEIDHIETTRTIGQSIVRYGPGRVVRQRQAWSAS